MFMFSCAGACSMVGLAMAPLIDLQQRVVRGDEK